MFILFVDVYFGKLDFKYNLNISRDDIFYKLLWFLFEMN